jgi:chemotaxis methyl-accepting protein methylase
MAEPIEQASEQTATQKLTEEREFEKILHFIKSSFKLDLTSYRRNFVFRHLRSRMHDVRCPTASKYISLLQEKPEELRDFVDTLSINVTHFFRDADVFSTFARTIVPEVMKAKGDGEQKLIRVWSAACASGQEPYSIAILLKELFADKPQILIKIVATDVDSDALARAEKGEYDIRDFRETDKKLLDKYFTPVYNKCYRINDDVRRLVRFQKHNLLTDEPLKFIDVIFCRNVMIYFSREQQDLLFRKFHQGLGFNGYLIIAKVETVWDKTLFSVVDSNHKIYQKIS